MMTATTSLNEDHLRIPPQGEGGYDVNWYPLIPSEAVKAGEIVGVPFLDGKVIAYRTESGTAHVTSAFCRHLGADLSIGKVVGEEVRCAFHHWFYNTEGKCTRIAGGDAPPDDGRLFVFPVVEKYGLIWAFNGDSSLFEAPHFNMPDEEIAWRLKPFIDLPQDHWVLLSNSMDFQHLETLHGLTVHTEPGDIKQPDDYHLEAPIAFSDPKFGRIDQFTRLFGTNCLTLTGEMNGEPMGTMFAGCPVGGGRTQGYIVTITRQAPANDDVAKQKEAAILEAGERFFLSLTEDDNVIMAGLRFRQDRLTQADWALAQFFDYVRSYPRAHPSSSYIR